MGPRGLHQTSGCQAPLPGAPALNGRLRPRAAGRPLGQADPGWTERRCLTAGPGSELPATVPAEPSRAPLNGVKVLWSPREVNGGMEG